MYPVSKDQKKQVPGQMQTKLLKDVIDCVVSLKEEFFQSQIPITDDNVTAQRFCAKLEHLLQVSLKEKTSVLGRKRDYWDWLAACLGTGRGAHDGVRYVKSLAEHKTSLGKGRALIRSV